MTARKFGLIELLNGGLRSVFPNIEFRHLHAVVAMAEELIVTRAAQRLGISQPALSKQITDLEEQLGYPLFVRSKKRIVALTDAGRIVVKEARSSLFRVEQAVHLGRAAHEGSDSLLMIGHSLHADRAWIADMLKIRPPSYPKLKILLRSQFAMESIRSVLSGEVNLALVTAPPPDAQITAVSFAKGPLYVALPVSHWAAQKEQLVLKDLARDEWILSPKRFDPIVFEAIMEAARRESIVPKNAHDIITSQEAIELVAESVGVAILAKPASPGFHADGVVIRPLCDTSLWFETCVIMRADDESELVNGFVRSFLRKYAPQRIPAQQLKLSLPA
jgi:DNA-binding transcriptional LysR family regulator